MSKKDDKKELLEIEKALILDIDYIDEKTLRRSQYNRKKRSK
jgi:hypothetical protein